MSWLHGLFLRDIYVELYQKNIKYHRSCFRYNSTFEIILWALGLFDSEALNPPIQSIFTGVVAVK